MPLVHEANAASLVGRVLRGRYKLLKPLGVGGMGAVYRAEHVHLGSIRAVKIMLSRHSDDPTLVKRFLREARGLAHLNHPNVVRVVDTGETEEGLPFIAMEFLEGEALSTTLRREGPLPWSVVKHIARQVCTALHAAHETGIIHRDVKPDNCFRVFDEEDGYRIKLLDFGIARFENDQVSQLTETGSVMGTLPYMSYEQICGQVCDRQSDIWSTAVMFYQLLCGELPFRGNNMGQLSYAIVQEDPTLVSYVRPDLELPPPLDDVLARAMAKDKRDRFRTMNSFLEAIEAVPNPLGYVKTEPFKNPLLPEERPDEDEATMSSTTEPWHGAGLSAHADDIEAFAEDHLTLDSKSVNVQDVPLNQQPITHRQSPSLALVALVGLVTFLAAWVVVRALSGPDQAATVAGKDPLPESVEKNLTTGNTPVSDEARRGSLPSESDGASFLAKDQMIETSAATFSETESTTFSGTLSEIDPSSETGGTSPAPSTSGTPDEATTQAKLAPKEPDIASKKPHRNKTKRVVPKPATEITCLSIKQNRNIRRCVQNCDDCTSPIRVRRKGTSLVVLGTNKSASSANGISLSVCLQKGFGKMQGALKLEKACEL